jgi:hypothetical protein
MPNKLQKERSTNVVMMIDEREVMLSSSKVVSDDCWQENNSEGYQNRLTLAALVVCWWDNLPFLVL